DLLGTKRFTPAIKEQFTAITTRAFEQLIGEKINQRLKGAMSPEPAPIFKNVTSLTPAASLDTTVTTTVEFEGFYAVRAMLRDLIPSRRIIMRDAQSYCAVLLDNNNRKPICRLRFNNEQKLKLGLFNDS